MMTIPHTRTLLYNVYRPTPAARSHVAMQHDSLATVAPHTPPQGQSEREYLYGRGRARLSSAASRLGLTALSSLSHKARPRRTPLRE